MSRLTSRAGRLREIETLLFRHTNGLSITEIAEHCEVNRRTIYRDIDLLGETGVPIWQEEGRYGIIRDQYLATIRLHFNEAVALYIASRLLARHADEHNPHNVSALTKLAMAFPDPLSGYINRTAEAIKDHPVNPTFVNVLEVITVCWVEMRKVRLWYRSPRSNEIRKRIFSPYTIEPATTGGLYVIGFDDWADDIRTFKLERLTHAEKLEDTYIIPDTFDLKTHLANAWGIMSGGEPIQVTLRFSKRVAPFIKERIWHSSQILTEIGEGFIQLQITVADTREMRPWIRSWGSEVEVLEPQGLRDDLIRESRELFRLYQINS